MGKEEKSGKSNREEKSKHEEKSSANSKNREEKSTAKECQEMSEKSDVPLNIDPEEAHFAHSGGKSEHLIVNFTPNKMAIKVRCGSKFYRIDPTHMIIDANQCRQMNITRSSGPIGNERVVVQYLQTDGSSEAKAVFKKAEAEGTTIPNIKIKLIASAAGGKKMSRELVDE